MTNEQYVPYSEYDVDQLRQWLAIAERYGDQEGARIFRRALAAKEKLEEEQAKEEFLEEYGATMEEWDQYADLEPLFGDMFI